jgi:hypothetical protein
MLGDTDMYSTHKLSALFPSLHICRGLCAIQTAGILVDVKSHLGRERVSGGFWNTALPTGTEVTTRSGRLHT